MTKTNTWTIVLLCFSANISAETTFTISPTLLYFDYTEFDTDDDVLNQETGWLPGLEARITQTITPKWQFDINTSYYQGTVDYDGQTQQGAPHTTNTDATMFRIGANVRRVIYRNIHLVVGAQSRRWERDINDSNNISGIDETYKWNEFSIGLNANFSLTQKDIINLEVSYLLIRNGTIFVDLTRANLGTTTLDLDDGTGARFIFNWTRKYKENLNFGANILFEGWDFGRSNTKQTENSSSIILVTEPRSETRNIGLQFNIEYLF